MSVAYISQFVAAKTTEIHLYPDEPRVVMYCFEGMILNGDRVVRGRESEILQPSRLQMHDVLFDLVPVKTWIVD